MTYIDPTSLIEYLKFGYTGNTIDLIYLILIGYIIGKIFIYIYKKIKKGKVI